MHRKKVRSLRCPTCRKIVLRNEPEFPFCSERCRMIDLGKWASGGYVISTPVNAADQLGDADYTLPEAPPYQQKRSAPGKPDGKHDKH